MKDDKIVSKIKEFTLKNSELDDTHGFKHVERVYNLSLLIGKKLTANLTVLKIAALLHDVGRIDEEKDEQNRNHAEISAQKALDYLNSNDFKISQNDIDNIIHCIKAHSFSNKINPQTLEAKILS
ncbi:MAG TPA: HD domain-containing protein, partial [Candidatus Lokiarchaeia archaeon]